MILHLLVYNAKMFPEALVLNKAFLVDCAALAGRKQIVIEVADIDAPSEEELEDIETPDLQRRKRWQRVAQAATKQCLR